jgi:serine/threonine protein kinase
MQPGEGVRHGGEAELVRTAVLQGRRQPAPNWAAGQLLLDDLEVEGPLGEGGMGTVYLVRSRFTRQRFAVKTIRSDRLDNPDSRRSFLHELQTWIDLPEHPHLTACRFFRTVEDQVAIFAEYVPGGSLAAAIRERRLTRLDQLLDVAIQFAWGLHAAHEHGVIHQDVKPGNVLLTADGVAKLTDFGLARAGSGWRGRQRRGSAEPPAELRRHDPGVLLAGAG